MSKPRKPTSGWVGPALTDHAVRDTKLPLEQNLFSASAGRSPWQCDGNDPVTHGIVIDGVLEIEPLDRSLSLD